MNTISSLETTDLPAAYHIEQRAHAFPWSEKTFASNQGERYLNFQLTQNGKMAAFAITQVVLDEATLFNIAVDPDYQRQGLGRALLEHLIDELEKRGWIERRESDNDRRCLHLQLTEKGHQFLREVLPPQHNCLHQLWSALSTTEKDQLEQITRKLLSRLDQMEQDGVVLEAMS